MKRAIKSIISIILVISMLVCATVPAFAAGTEEYISELRLIYADDYNEAKGILADSEFSDYKLLKENLNKDSDEIGVWLAYKTTTNIEDAITDLAVMQMNGGYTEGNFQEMIKQSYAEYVTMGEIYLQAIEYFVEAYDAGDFLAESAFRQLNFYNVVSEGIPKSQIPSFEGERLGDIFLDGIDKYELATIFFEGNTYALANIRSLLAMGVSYNENGKNYLEMVGEEALRMTSDANVYDEEDYEDLAKLIAPAINVIKDMLKDLDAYEDELNYEDEDFTSTELELIENKAVAEMLRDVDYLDGKTLYDFCLKYEISEDDYSSLYPLVAALNEGQLAITKVAHFYDVIRYSMSEYPEELIISELDKMEEIYNDNPFNVYSGVDRSVYNGTFALTSEADRADAYGEVGVYDALFGEGRWKSTACYLAAEVVGIGIFAGALAIRYGSNAIAAATKATTTLKSAITDIAAQNISKYGYAIYITTGADTSVAVTTYGDMINTLLVKYGMLSKGTLANYTMFEKYQMLMSKAHFPKEDLTGIKQLTASLKSKTNGEFTTYKAYQATLDSGSTMQILSNVLLVVGGAIMLYSAYKLGMTVYNYYHPEYEDVPIAMVDLVETVDGDRYIKYDVVFNAETNKDGVYEAADLNAFSARRWNALYYTKSYEAGKPLLADEFILSYTNNQVKDGYTPVHRFGEVVCYDLNKYNFEGNTHIYLSVKQSKNNKSAVADVPEVVGSMFGAGFLILAGGIGVVVGIGGTVATNVILKKKKNNACANAQA